MKNKLDNKRLNIGELLEAFASDDCVYKRREVEEAVARKDESIPVLLTVLRDLLADPEAFVTDNGYLLHSYALNILGHLKVREAHELIIACASMPKDRTYDLFSDMITEDFPILLLETCDGDFEAIRALALNESIDPYCSGAAIGALAYAVAEDMLPREEVLEFYAEALRSALTGTDSEVPTFIATAMHDLRPVEYMDLIEQCYEADIIDSHHINYDNFSAGMMYEEHALLVRKHHEFMRRSNSDVHKRMTWWACFKGTASMQGLMNTSVTPRKRSGKKKQSVRAAQKKARKNNRKR